MIAIRAEIQAVEDGRLPIEQSPLRHAPHTVDDLADNEWSRPYSRAQGCFPAGSSADKYWAPVNRIDNSYGDRSEEHTSELQSLMRISYAVFCLKKKKKNKNTITT